MRTWYVVVLIFFVAVLAGAGAVLSKRLHHHRPVAGAYAAFERATYAEGSHSAPPSGSAPAGSTSGGGDVRILVYHIVRPSYSTDTRAVKNLAQTPEVFDAQMAHLRDAGYHVISFAELEGHLASSTPLPAKPIILSFDDGWQDQFAYAFPILQKYGYKATFFVFTNAIGHKDFMSWSNLHALVADGMTIGDHTRSHPFLTKIRSATKLEDEIVGSKTILENELHVPITEFAYPFGQHNASTTAIIKAAGYRSARGDYYTGAQSLDKLYLLSAMNAPTTTTRFNQYFP